MDLKNRKISVVVILTALLLILYSVIAVDKNTSGFVFYNEGMTMDTRKENIQQFTVDILFFETDYLSTVFVLLIALGLGIYFLIYKDDEELLSSVKFFKNKSGIAFTKYKLGHKPSFNNHKFFKSPFYLKLTNLLDKGHFWKKRRVIKLNDWGSSMYLEVDGVTRKEKYLKVSLLIILLWALPISVFSGFYIAFFLPLAYYCSLLLKPSAKKNLLIKSLLISFLFYFLLTLLGTSMAISNSIYKTSVWYHLGGEIGKGLVPFIISVIIIYKRTPIGPRPSPEFKLNWVFLFIIILFLLIGTAVVYTNVIVSEVFSNL